jgi:hypothetical protein
MVEMNKNLLSRLILHGAAGLIYPASVSCLFFLYQFMGGRITSRGVAAGMAVQLIFYFVAAINFLMVAIPSIRARMWIMLIMGLGIFLYLAPVHPIRAVLLSGLACAVTMIPIFGPALRAKIMGDKAL